jgi:hypothetical protein
VRGMTIPWLAAGIAWLALGALSPVSAAQQTPPQPLAISVVVTVKPKHGKDAPEINHSEDIRAFEGLERLTVTAWTPLQGNQANLELLILLDEATGGSLANKLVDVRKFIGGQPPTTTIAVGYIESGAVRMAQNFTTDHIAASQALRVPQGVGAAGTSPYLSVTNVLKRWRGSNSRHAILLVTDGIDPLQRGVVDTYLNETIALAEQANTQVSAIYAARNGLASRLARMVDQGQNNLSNLAAATGGDAYFQGHATPVSFAPTLDEFGARLAHQYLLTFSIRPQKKPSYGHIRLETEVPNADLVVADHVFVPAAE